MGVKLKISNKHKKHINESSPASGVDMKQKGRDAFWEAIEKIKSGQSNATNGGGTPGGGGGMPRPGGQGGNGQGTPVRLPIPNGVPRPLSDEAQRFGCDNTIKDGEVYRNDKGENIMNVNSGTGMDGKPVLGRDMAGAKEMEELAKRSGNDGVKCSEDDAKKVMDDLRRNENFAKKMRNTKINTGKDKQNNGGNGMSSLWDFVYDILKTDDPLLPWQDVLREFMNMPEPEQEWQRSSPRIAWGDIDTDLDPMQHLDAVQREIESRNDSMITDVFYLIDASGSMNLNAIANGIMSEIMGIETECGVMKSGLAYFCDGISKKEGCIRHWERNEPREEIDVPAIVKYISPDGKKDYLDGGTNLTKALTDLQTYGKDYFDSTETRLIIITDMDGGTELNQAAMQKLRSSVDKVFFLVVNNRNALKDYINKLKSMTNLSSGEIAGLAFEDLI